MGKYRRFTVVVRGDIEVEVKAEHQEIAQAMVEAAIVERDARKYGLKKKQLEAIRRMKRTSFSVWIIPIIPRWLRKFRPGYER
jgi:hypothetical protein